MLSGVVCVVRHHQWLAEENRQTQGWDLRCKRCGKQRSTCPGDPQLRPQGRPEHEPPNGWNSSMRVVRSLPGPVVALTAAVLAVVGLVSGLSYPGFPVDVAACAVVAVMISMAVITTLAVRATVARSGRLRAVVVLVLAGAVLSAGVFTARADDGRRLQARWAASEAAFEREVSTAGVPERLETSSDPGSFARYPGACSARIGGFSIGECRAVDGGFLFLQSQSALTDDSGIVYLPEAARLGSSWWDAETMTRLNGPWWSWSCRC